MLVLTTPPVHIALPHLGEPLWVYLQWRRKLKCRPPMNYVLTLPSDICLNHSTMRGSRMDIVYEKAMTMTIAIVINATILSKLFQTSLRAINRISRTHGSPTILLTRPVPIPRGIPCAHTNDLTSLSFFSPTFLGHRASNGGGCRLQPSSWPRSPTSWPRSVPSNTVAPGQIGFNVRI